jgi:hypothetical protein
VCVQVTGMRWVGAVVLGLFQGSALRSGCSKRGRGAATRHGDGQVVYKGSISVNMIASYYTSAVLAQSGVGHEF